MMSIDRNKFKEALKEMREKSKKRNFNQSIELIINLRGLDVKKSGNRIQERIELPHLINKTIKVCVFANGDMAFRARKGNTDLVLESSEIEEIMKDKKRQRQIANSADFFVASAPLMPLVGRALGSILGPRGKMPTPLPPTANIEEEVERHRRMVFIRTRNQPVLQCRIGTYDMSDDALFDNFQAIINGVTRRLERGSKNISTIHIKPTMGSPIKVS
jgi:large subunit ribosomal protein L1